MNTLMIQDLSHTEALDGKAMANVRGGYARLLGDLYYPGYIDTSYNDFSVKQANWQQQKADVFAGNNSAIIGGGSISVTSAPVQVGQNFA